MILGALLRHVAAEHRLQRRVDLEKAPVKQHRRIVGNPGR
jgi:hypothetical protein